MSGRSGSSDIEEYRRRIRLLRRMFGMNQVEFCKYIGIDYKTWNHYERGYPISQKTARMLKEKIPGVSVDWIWFGEQWNVEAELLKTLQRLDREERKLGPGEQEPTRIIPKVRRRISKTNAPRRKASHAAE
jgi:DNA-binding XRE family transcriptional regulator